MPTVTHNRRCQPRAHSDRTLAAEFVGAVAPQKYRSPERRDILTTGRRLLHLIDRWDQIFPERFFPRFATRGGFP